MLSNQQNIPEIYCINTAAPVTWPALPTAIIHTHNEEVFLVILHDNTAKKLPVPNETGW